MGQMFGPMFRRRVLLPRRRREFNPVRLSVGQFLGILSHLKTKNSGSTTLGGMSIEFEYQSENPKVSPAAPSSEKKGRRLTPELRGSDGGNIAGFSLIELVVVLSLISIVAIVSVPRFENLPQTRAYYTACKLRSDIRYAQSLAVQTQTRTRVVFDAVLDNYRLERESVPGTWISIIHPSTKSSYQVALNSGDLKGVDLTQAVFNGNSTLIFDSYGTPFDSAGNPIAEPAYAELNAKYRLELRRETGKVDLVTL